MQTLISELNSKFYFEKVDYVKANLAFVTIKKEQATNLILHLKEVVGFKHLVMISAVDYIEKEIFQVTYILHNYVTGLDFGLRVELDRNEPVMDSIHMLWPAAGVYQREIHEMYGIEFPGSPNQDKPMILEGWQDIPPMRKDFDTRQYSENTYFPREGRYTIDPIDRMEEKLYPNEAKIKKEIKDKLRKGEKGKDKAHE